MILKQNKICELLTVPSIRSILLWSIPARLHLSVTSIAIVLLLLERTDSAAKAGIIASGLVLGQGITGPIRGRYVDTHRTSVGLKVTSIAYGIGLIGLPVVLSESLFSGYLLVFLAGLMCPPSTQVSRAKLAQAAADTERNRVYALQSVISELVLICGPALVAFVVAAFSPSIAMQVSGAIAIIGGLGLARSCRYFGIDHPPSSSAANQPRGRLSSAAWRIIVSVAVLGGFVYVDRFVSTFWSGNSGESSLGAILIVIWAVGSMLGGIISGSKEQTYSLIIPFLAVVFLTAVLTVMMYIFQANSQGLLLLGTVLLVHGGFITPCLARLYSSLAVLAGAARARAFGWKASFTTASGAVASAIGGAVSESHSPYILIAVATVLLAAVFLWAPRINNENTVKVVL
ncbi:MFS transporter [Corynebacterium belfantii]|uniref:MFS transporter n=1 Tax=Corynebacterium belfantii TaxID=2014537 RepID=UPI00248B51BD|nr:MFS transporter [Corynebacterium belfantii]